MLRRALTLLLTVALLLALGWLGVRSLGWWTGEGPPPSPEAQQAKTAQAPLPVKPADSLAAPQPTAAQEGAAQGDAGKPVPHAAPTPPVPQVRLLPVPARPAPTPPRPEVTLPSSPIPSAPTSAAPTDTASPLDALNAVRLLAGLPAVRDEPKWQAECGAHALYLTATDTGGHHEDPADPHYTPAGAACAHGHYYVTGRPGATAAQAVAYWQGGPFHLPQLLDPRLTRAALAVRHDAVGDLRTAAVLDVKRGRDGAAKYPVRFPRPGSTVTPQALSRFEFPDALPACPGYAHPAGAPIALLLGEGGNVRQVSLTVDGQPAEVCLLTAQTFTGADEGQTKMGRSVLAAQGAAVALPRRPLPPSSRVDVRFQTAAGPLGWSFLTR